MPVSPLEYLRHIRDEARYLAEEAGRITKSDFIASETAKRACVRSIEISQDHDVRFWRILEDHL